jgi:hypothetical protein
MTKKEQNLLKEQVDRLQNQLNASLQINKEMEEAMDKLINKYDLVLQSHRVTTQIFSQN